MCTGALLRVVRRLRYLTGFFPLLFGRFYFDCRGRDRVGREITLYCTMSFSFSSSKSPPESLRSTEGWKREEYGRDDGSLREACRLLIRPTNIVGHFKWFRALSHVGLVSDSSRRPWRSNATENPKRTPRQIIGRAGCGYAPAHAASFKACCRNGTLQRAVAAR